mmetsp:Transcript_75645/g.162226  ORF Transcript_75645/g.162226 Transcript_75645/m.162226 type:complete len:251 (+) Transcript_75645:626-1378(+)
MWAPRWGSVLLRGRRHRHHLLALAGAPRHRGRGHACHCGVPRDHGRGHACQCGCRLLRHQGAHAACQEPHANAICRDGARAADAADARRHDWTLELAAHDTRRWGAGPAATVLQAGGGREGKRRRAQRPCLAHVAQHRCRALAPGPTLGRGTWGRYTCRCQSRPALSARMLRQRRAAGPNLGAARSPLRGARATAAPRVRAEVPGKCRHASPLRGRRRRLRRLCQGALTLCSFGAGAGRARYALDLLGQS